jgi:hypothetical protein
MLRWIALSSCVCVAVIVGGWVGVSEIVTSTTEWGRSSMFHYLYCVCVCVCRS